MSAAATVGEALAPAARRLREAGIAVPRREAARLLALALGHDSGPPADRPVTSAQAERFERFVERRARREPFARIAGEREFWSLPFRLSAETLIPRPDSETLVEAALDELGGRDQAVCILDLGTGSGCLLLALLHELANAEGVGIDSSLGAVACARANARALGLAGRARFVCGSWGESLNARFDVVVCNPPYVAEGEIESLEPEVRAFEPRHALAGGADGLDALRALAPALGGLLAPRGAAFIEIGRGQTAAAADILARNELSPAAVRRDLAGIPRCLIASPGRGSRKKLLENGRFPTTFAGLVATRGHGAGADRGADRSLTSPSRTEPDQGYRPCGPRSRHGGPGGRGETL